MKKPTKKDLFRLGYMILHGPKAKTRPLKRFKPVNFFADIEREGMEDGKRRKRRTDNKST